MASEDHGEALQFFYSLLGAELDETADDELIGWLNP